MERDVELEEYFGQDVPFISRREPLTVRPGIHLLSSMGYILAVDLGDQVFLMDTGPSRNEGRRLAGQLKSLTSKSVKAIAFSHGHWEWNAGLEAWLTPDTTGGVRPTIIAHERVRARFARYEQMPGLQRFLLSLQFQGKDWGGDANSLPLEDPDVAFADTYTVRGSERSVRLIHAPSETDDAIVAWIPEERVLYGGAAFLKSIPNIGTPLRIQRDSLRWADTLDMMAALNPLVLLGSHGMPIEGEQEVQHVLSSTAEALRWIHREVVSRLNRAMTVEEILDDIDLPEKLFNLPWLRPVYGSPEFVVRDVYRAETGWWDWNPTTLAPLGHRAKGEAVLSAIADPAYVLASADRLRAEGDLERALVVLDLLAWTDFVDECEGVREALQMKQQICRELSSTATNTIKRNMYATGARRIEKTLNRDSAECGS